MLRALFFAMLFAFPLHALAGKVYRCPDGSYQDKPCGEGDRVVANNNRKAAPPPGADRACFDRGLEAKRLAKMREGKIPIETIVDRIEQSGRPYQQQLDEKTFAVKVYQAKGNPIEVQTLFESDCVAEKQKESSKTPTAQAVPTTTPEPKSAPAESANADDKSRSQLCGKLKLDKKANVVKARSGGSGDEMEELMDQRKLIDEQLRELCS